MQRLRNVEEDSYCTILEKHMIKPNVMICVIIVPWVADVVVITIWCVSKNPTLSLSVGMMAAHVYDSFVALCIFFKYLW